MTSKADKAEMKKMKRIMMTFNSNNYSIINMSKDLSPGEIYSFTESWDQGNSATFLSKKFVFP